MRPQDQEEVKREVLVGRDAHRMNNYIKRSVGLNFVREKDSEVDSWHKGSVQAVAEKSAEQYKLAWKDELEYMGEVRHDRRDLSSAGDDTVEQKIDVPQSLKNNSEVVGNTKHSIRMAVAQFQLHDDAANGRN